MVLNFKLLHRIQLFELINIEFYMTTKTPLTKQSCIVCKLFGNSG